MKYRFACVCAFVFACSTSARADIISFREGVSPTGSYNHFGLDFRTNGQVNTSAELLVGNQVSGVGLIRSLLGFDLSAIPAGSTINSITFTMKAFGTSTGTLAGVGDINVYEIRPNGNANNNMVETETSTTVWSTGNPWTNTLGDFESAILSTSVVNNANANTTLDAGETITYNSSAAWVALAQSSLDAGLPLEFMLRSPTAEAGGVSNFYRMGSDGAVAVGDRPLLTIDYTAAVPEPGLVALGLLTTAGFFGWRRLRNNRC